MGVFLFVVTALAGHHQMPQLVKAVTTNKIFFLKTIVTRISLKLTTRGNDTIMVLLVMSQVKMTESKITFHNQTEIKTQAQIYAGRDLVSSCVAAPGETCVLPANSVQYDIFFKNGITGWEMARKLDSEDTTLALQQRGGRYIVIGS